MKDSKIPSVKRLEVEGWRQAGTIRSRLPTIPRGMHVGEGPTGRQRKLGGERERGVKVYTLGSVLDGWGVDRDVN